jgi:AcrR family transcriptional regulator
MSAIAESAGFAVQTVYFVFHTKAELLNQVYATVVLGEDSPTPPDQTDWFQTALASTDPRHALDAFAAGTCDLLRRISDLDLVVRTAASSEPDIMAAHQRGESLRAQGYRRFVDSLIARGFVNAQIDPQEATDVLLSLFGPALYLTFTRDRAWTHQHFLDWIVEAMRLLIFR